MRQTTTWLAGCTAVLTLIAAPIAAKPSNTPKGPKAAVARPAAPATMKVSGQTKASAPTPARATSPKPAHATSPKAGQKSGSTTTTSGSHAASSTPGATPAGGTTIGGTRWTPTNSVARKLSTKPQMLAKVQRVLPGVKDLNAATAGFKNYGQFVAAVNASQNHGVSFAKLKALMTGINMDGTRTGEPTMSLGQAKKVLQTTSTGTTTRTPETTTPKAPGTTTPKAPETTTPKAPGTTTPTAPGTTTPTAPGTTTPTAPGTPRTGK